MGVCPSPLSQQKKNLNRFGLGFIGGDEGGRTPYLLNAIQTLYQLSYTPKQVVLYHIPKKMQSFKGSWAKFFDVDLDGCHY